MNPLLALDFAAQFASENITIQKTSNPRVLALPYYASTSALEVDNLVLRPTLMLLRASCAVRGLHQLQDGSTEVERIVLFTYSDDADACNLQTALFSLRLSGRSGKSYNVVGSIKRSKFSTFYAQALSRSNAHRTHFMYRITNLESSTMHEE